MLIAITGATGFLGHYIVNHLLKRRDACRCWVRPQADRDGFVDGDLRWLPGELGDPRAAESLVRGVDAVVHGALAWPPGAGEAPLEFMRLNIMGSLELMDIARRAGVKRFIFISTCAVHEKILDDRPLDEAHPLWPSSHYGAYKAAVEKFVHSYGLGQGWPICSLRPTGIHGLRRPLEKSRWLGVVQKVMNNEIIDSQWGGKQVHAADVASAVALLLDAPTERIAGEAFNCYDQYVTEERVATIAKQITGSASKIVPYGKKPKHEIDTRKIQALGMRFGGDASLEYYMRELINAVKDK